MSKPPRLNRCFSSTICWTLLAGGMALAGLCPVEAWQPAAEWWTPAVQSRLDQAGPNGAEIRRALADCPLDQRRELAFLVEHMPVADLQSLQAGYLLENVRLACSARQSVPWQVPDEVFLNDVLPYACVDELREPWRAGMRQRCWPLVQRCQTPGEAAQVLNRELFPLIDVRYSTTRQKPNQSPAESMSQSVASCTGLSILLVDACRSVGVPARLAGTPAWTTKRGNHTWVEIWDQGWHFTGAAEPDDRGLNHAWFTADAARADTGQPAHRIYATSYAATGMHFPLVWSPGKTTVPAVNVTDRYTADRPAIPATAARVLIQVLDTTGQRLAVSVEVTAVTGESPPLTGTSRAGTADMNDVLEFQLAKGREYRVRLQHDDKSIVHCRTVAGQEQSVWRFTWPGQ